MKFKHEPATLDILETDSEDSEDSSVSESSVAYTKDSIDDYKLY